MGLLRRPKRAPLVRDDFGGGPDGSLAIFDVAAERGIHTTSARVAASLRYLVARVRIHDGEEFPACLALTAALRGEGVTFVTHSLASVIAYDTARSVVVVDLNWAAPVGSGPRRRRSLRSGPVSATPPPAFPAFQPGVVVAGEPSFGRRPTDTPDDAAARADEAEQPATKPARRKDARRAAVEQVEETDETDDTDETDEPVGTDEIGDTEDRDEEPAETTVKGLIDVINGTAGLEEIIRPTSNPRLSLIRPGVAAFAHRPGLAGDPRLRAIVDELREQFDHVLLDLPPVLASSEAIILAELADAYVLVVRQGVTSEQHVAAAVEELQGSPALGVVLNRVESSVPKPLRRLLGV